MAQRLRALAVLAEVSGWILSTHMALVMIVPGYLMLSSGHWMLHACDAQTSKLTAALAECPGALVELS